MAKVCVQVRIDQELYDWLKSDFPHGFIQNFLEQCLINLEELIKHKTLPPLTDYSKFSTVNTVMDLIDYRKEEE